MPFNLGNQNPLTPEEEANPDIPGSAANMARAAAANKAEEQRRFEQQQSGADGGGDDGDDGFWRTVEGTSSAAGQTPVVTYEIDRSTIRAAMTCLRPERACHET